jgi:hypothetical protein
MIVRVRVVWWMTGSLNHIALCGIDAFIHMLSKGIERCRAATHQAKGAEHGGRRDWLTGMTVPREMELLHSKGFA